MKISPVAPMVLVSLAGFGNTAFATQYLTTEQAQKAIFADATSFKEVTVQLTADQMHQMEKLSGLPARSVAWHTFSAYKDDKLIG
jgi:hypothetical protein